MSEAAAERVALDASGSVFDATEFSRRHERVRERMLAERLDALIAYSNASVRGPVRYLSNYFSRQMGAQSKQDGSYYAYGSAALLFPLDEEPTLITDQLWDVERAREISIFPDTFPSEDFAVELGHRIAAAGYERIGIDNWSIFPAARYLKLREHAPRAELVPTQLIEETYKVKSPAEVELMRKAEQAAVRAVDVGISAVGIGVGDFEFALAAENALREFGDIDTPGPSIVYGGHRTAASSGVPSQTDSYVMQRGDWAMFDITPAHHGYAGDISRMVVAGRVEDLDPQLRRLYDAALRINETVIEAIRPGAIPADLNRLATEIAVDAGFGKNKVGLLGHGLGLDMHDPPDYYYDRGPLEPGMVFTVEPCLVIPGVAGVRIEDVVLVTTDGCEVLSEASPKQLRGTEG
jgi:Xaa-Pro aminopeptidase